MKSCIENIGEKVGLYMHGHEAADAPDLHKILIL